MMYCLKYFRRQHWWSQQFFATVGGAAVALFSDCFAICDVMLALFGTRVTSFLAILVTLFSQFFLAKFWKAGSTPKKKTFSDCEKCLKQFWQTRSFLKSINTYLASEMPCQFLFAAKRVLLTADVDHYHTYHPSVSPPSILVACRRTRHPFCECCGNACVSRQGHK